LWPELDDHAEQAAQVLAIELGCGIVEQQERLEALFPSMVCELTQDERSSEQLLLAA
jgi:hypothetical protein